MVEESISLGEPTVKRIHVDMHRIRENTKTGSNIPPLTVQAFGGPYKAHRIKIHGPSELVYEPQDPLSCGARVWIETIAALDLIVEDGM